MELRIFGLNVFRPFSGVRRGEARPAAVQPAGRLAEVAVLSPEAALARLDTSFDGLLEREAEERLATYGENAVAHEVKKSPVRRLLELFATPLSLLLLSLAIIAELTGEVRGAIVITLMVVLSVLLSWVQEFRSNKAAEKLRAMVNTTATVLRKDKRKGVPEEINRLFEVQLRYRGPQAVEVPLNRVVPGDIVRLSAGDMIPADVRVLSAKDLFVNQAALTGESLPVEKFAAAANSVARSVLEFQNVCFMGTNVVSGTADRCRRRDRARHLFRVHRHGGCGPEGSSPVSTGG